MGLTLEVYLGAGVDPAQLGRGAGESWSRANVLHRWTETTSGRGPGSCAEAPPRGGPRL